MSRFLKHSAVKKNSPLAMLFRVAITFCLWLLCIATTPHIAHAVKSAVNFSLEANYLAARQASYLNDLGAAADFYLAALRQDNSNPDLLQQSFVTQYMVGNIDLAASLARQMETLNLRINYASEPATAQAILRQDWDAVIVLVDQIAETVSARPIAAVTRAWALTAKGQSAAGISELLKTGQSLALEKQKLAPMFYMQAAHLAEVSGYKVEQRNYMKKLLAEEVLPSQIILQLAAMLVRDGDKAKALAKIEQLPNGFALKQVRLLLDNQDAPKDIAGQIARAIVDASLIIKEAEARQMLPARLGLALHLDPNFDAARFFLAQALAEKGADQFVQLQLDAISDDSVWNQPRLLIQLDMEQRKDINAAITRLKRALVIDQDNGFLFEELGDLYRHNDEFVKSRDAYLEAQRLGYDSRNIDRSLAIAYERLDQDELAEKHFAKALQINPNDPFTLNYLGYWWADNGRNLEQAIKLIERAVQLRPKSGFFVDSLGWVHFKLGNFDLAVAFLEKATLLEPADPVITDHLGDAYWRVGRHVEARYKWTYALSITTEDDLKEQIQTKLAR